MAAASRPDTRKHLNLRAQLSKNLLHPKGRPHTDTRKHLNLRAQLSKNLLHPKGRPHTDFHWIRFRVFFSDAPSGRNEALISTPAELVLTFRTDLDPGRRLAHR